MSKGIDPDVLAGLTEEEIRGELTERQNTFVDAFLQIGKPYPAARAAGYESSALQASSFLEQPLIAELVRRKFEAERMAPAEVCARWARIARMNLADVLKTTPLDSGRTKVEPDWDAVKEHGDLIKSIKPTRYGWEIQLFDKVTVLDSIAKSLGLFKAPEGSDLENSPFMRLLNKLAEPE